MADLDPLIHQPVRLRIMATLTDLDTTTRVDFAYLRTFLHVTDGNLGAHLRKLEIAGYVRIEKTYVARKPRTYIAVTTLGQNAFAEHVAALAEILERGKI